MHALILAGGKGLRLKELTWSQPKGLLPIGEHAMLDLIVHHLASQGVTGVSIAGGYRLELLEQHFASTNSAIPVSVFDTGLDTASGTRVKRLVSACGISEKPVIMCWSDALSNIDFAAMFAQHTQSDAAVTVAAVHPPARFGELTLDGQRIAEYQEKPIQTERWVSGGYFVFDPSVVRALGDRASWENDLLATLAQESKLDAYRHSGAWVCMDTLNDYQTMQQLHQDGRQFWPSPGQEMSE